MTLNGLKAMNLILSQAVGFGSHCSYGTGILSIEPFPLLFSRHDPLHWTDFREGSRSVPALCIHRALWSAIFVVLGCWELTLKPLLNPQQLMRIVCKRFKY